jgi:hypothetical protein
MVAATVMLSLVSVPSAQAQVGVNYSYNLTPLRTVERTTNTGTAISITNTTRKTAWCFVSALQDIADTSTNTMAVTYTPTGGLATYRVGAWTAVVGAAEATQVLTNYPILKYGDVITFDPDATTNVYIQVTYFEITSYNP